MLRIRWVRVEAEALHIPMLEAAVVHDKLVMVEEAVLRRQTVAVEVQHRPMQGEEELLQTQAEAAEAALMSLRPSLRRHMSSSLLHGVSWFLQYL
jgi:hypothetical protein